MKIYRSLKRFIAALSSAAMMLTSTGLVYTPETVYANGDQPGQEQNTVGQLADVTDLQWVENSSATVSWTAAPDANYYAVTVKVYEDDGETFIGSDTTGTTATELDVQQEIHNVIGEAEYDTVKVTATVFSQKKQDDEVVAQGEGVTTGLWEYRMNIICIPTPTNIKLSDDYILTFDCDVDDPEENVDQNYGYQMYFYSANDRSGCTSSGASGIKWENGTGCIDIKAEISRIYKIAAFSSDEDVYVSISIMLNAKSAGYTNSKWSDFSNGVKYQKNLIVIPTPTNINLSEGYILTFDCDVDDPEENVDQNYGYQMYFYSANDRSGCTSSGASGIKWENGTGSIDIKAEISRIYKIAAFSSDEDVYVSISIMLYAKSDDYTNSKWSDFSNGVKYQKNLIVIPTPININLSEDYVLTFDCDVDDPEENVDQNYGYQMYFYSANDRSGCTSSGASGIKWENGTGSIDIKAEISRIYKIAAFSSDEDIYVSISIMLYAKSDDYTNSKWSDFSNGVVYDYHTPVSALTLAPSAPIICLGHFYYLGKTIDPLDAYYDDIDWTSADENIVTVSEDGLITGVSVGTADVTAAIGDVDDTVPVTVYEITSNISEQEGLDEEDEEEIIDTAGNIIDDIANNDAPDLSNTDIDKDDLDDLQEEITEAAQNGADFWINFKDLGRGLGHYKAYWDDPDFWKWYEEHYGTGNGWHLGWGKDVVYEIGYTDANGEDHHIGNITEFEKEYGFVIEIPEDAEIEELKNGKTRIYNVVRYHDGVYEVVDIEVMKNGKIKVLSDKYSDFILLYKDVDTAHQHSAAFTAAKAATCTADGNTAYWYCSDCKKYFSDEACTDEITLASTVIAAVGHTPAEPIKENETAPTCTDDGSYDEVVYCSVCGEELSRKTVSVEATGHSWGEWETVTEPTYTTEGLEKRVCLNDPDHTETRAIPKLGSVIGDANGDGIFNMQDYAILQRFLAGWDVEIDKDACDLNGDGDVNMLDYALMQRLLAGWDIDS